MKDRYRQRFQQLAKAGQKAFIPFTVLGWPNADRCLQTIKCMIDSGASALELGIAFSDPVADGPIIQAAAFETLDRGFSLVDAFTLLKEVRQYNQEIPIGLLLYYNTVLSQGAANFFQNAAACGVDSILIADLPMESAAEVLPAAQKADIDLVFIISPLTSDERLKTIASQAGAYLYVVSRLGITGTQERYDENLAQLVARARQCSTLPLCVGFGVSTPTQAGKMMALGIDGVITGSKIVEIIRADDSANLNQLRAYLEQMCHTMSQQAVI